MWRLRWISTRENILHFQYYIYVCTMWRWHGGYQITSAHGKPHRTVIVLYMGIRGSILSSNATKLFVVVRYTAKTFLYYKKPLYDPLSTTKALSLWPSLYYQSPLSLGPMCVKSHDLTVCKPCLVHSYVKRRTKLNTRFLAHCHDNLLDSFCFSKY